MHYDKMSREELIEELQKSKKYNKSDFHHINSNKEWEQTFNALPDLIAIIDVNHHIKRVNKAMTDRLNIEPNDLVGNTCFSLIHGTNEPPDFCPHKELLKDMKAHSNEIPIKSLQGDFLVSVSPIFDDNGQLNGSVHIAHDITERKKLGELTRLLADIVKSSNDIIIGKDLEGNITSWNRAAQEMYGYSEEEMIGNSISILLPKNLSDDLDQIMGKIKRGESIKHHDSVRLKKVGKLIDVSLYISPIFDSNGNVTGASTIAHDITDRKMLEKELKESEEKFREVFNNANDMISLNIIKEDGLPGKFIEINKMGIERLGYSRDELLDMTPGELVVPDKRSEMPLNALKLSEKGHVEFEIIHKTKEGKHIPVEVNNHLFELNGQKVALAVTRDITERKKAEMALKESEEKFREVFNNANDAMFLHKLEGEKPGKFFEVNDVACQSLGYSRNEMQKMDPNDIDTPESIAQIPKVMSNLLKDGKTTFEAVQITKDGKLFPVEINAHIFVIRDEKYILSISRDLRERKKAEDALKNSELKYRTIFENVQDVFYQIDKNGNIIEISPSIERYSGYKSSELKGKPVETVYLNPEDRKNLLKELENKGEVVDYELKLKTKSNDKLYVSTNAHFIFDSYKNPIGIEGSLRDVSERKNIELKLKNSLIEKEMLLKEIHHRVKNNLMIISSLLNIQSSYITDKESKEIFKESQNRAKSMALIHERLYQSTDLKRIDFGDYIQSLSTELFHTYVADPSIIALKTNVEDIYLDINTAIPLGLIVNELITNSLKHAFPRGMTGEIDVDFHMVKDHYEFTVKDNGIGFPDTLDYKNTESLGMQMVNSLTEQIDGEIELNNEKGTSFKITFKETEII